MADPVVLDAAMVAAIRKNSVVELVEGVVYVLTAYEGMEALLAGFVCILLWCLLLATTLIMLVDSTIAVVGDIRYVAVQYQAMVDTTLDPMPTMVLWNTLIAVFCRISYFLGDVIVIWRAWVLYQRNLVVKAILGASVALSLACAIYDSVAAATMNLFQPVFGSTRFLLPSAVIFINALSTSLIGYRAWGHRKLIKTLLDGTSKRSQAMECLILLIESGALYCIFWILVVLSMTVENFDNTAGSYLNDILPHMEAIYPTTIILLTALKKTHCDTTLQGRQTQGSSSIRFAPSPPSQLSQSVQFSVGAGAMHSRSFGGEEVESIPESDQVVIVKACSRTLYKARICSPHLNRVGHELQKLAGTRKYTHEKLTLSYKANQKKDLSLLNPTA
ncbi:hypothetical protein K435DRAFT_837583 [Dendrothele bispora CBS 962.96]|uniref:Uncharacterized protein n=1 Tax=Dendrothele bispora (strain CBS 962.96) TaxID=1314807 RepID=A0A4S8MB32_DENBC|nr:hypothetical protein K435DRAFT_837583 [Dendrothele bispora CBS 962.96]